ncbi:hypothetical protein LTR99_007856 [Exophiala xenobiotica]|nr:hypothetical protein LTR72_005219 [Exophiala xenobiotica]KAK5236523.1 hypothetical protein LTR47_002474 [Exophiala xenobiotica]KAK5289234.1 hypothetical protein LTR14_007485 [Exophiala xenobiotica]KAK5298167.1 hypothetical protein LTR99_007856 [Exophiala xenobiotica]KAK5323307.1 hypothetical protein LTR93_005360 [Exophiala xenobiotica]
MFSQILRFTLPHPQTISSSEFHALREHVSKVCLSQYFGYTVSAPLPRKNEEICWAIQWPSSSTPAQRAEALKSSHENIIGPDATSLLLEFSDEQMVELVNAFEAPVCEFPQPLAFVQPGPNRKHEALAFIALSSKAPLSSPELKKSMHKTYTDVFGMRGFVGGQWSYCLNTNDSAGMPLSMSGEEHTLPLAKRRVAVYPLGWESVELHQAATKTALFAEEIDKLAPYFGPGTGAFYVSFRRHRIP